MSGIPTPQEAAKFLDLFFDLELANKQLVEQDPELGEIKETTRLQCIIASKNARKFYHITQYEFGYIAFYGRLDDALEPKYQSPHIKKFTYRAEAEKAYREKVDSKLYPPSGKDKYKIVLVEDHH